MDRTLTPEQQKYNKDSLLCDQMWAFHPDIFDVLDAKETADLFKLYPQDFTHIPDAFAYRKKLIAEDPRLEVRARSALAKVLAEVGLALDD